MLDKFARWCARVAQFGYGGMSYEKCEGDLRLFAAKITLKRKYIGCPCLTPF